MLCFLDFDVTFVGRSECESWEMCASAGTSVSSRLSVNSSNHSGSSRKRSSASRLPFLSIFVSGFWCDPHQFPGGSSSLRSWAGLVVDKSCDVDVDDELLPELVDNPGTTRGTKLSVFHTIVFSSLVNRGFWPLTHSQEYSFWWTRWHKEKSVSTVSKGKKKRDKGKCQYQNRDSDPPWLAVQITIRGGLDRELKKNDATDLAMRGCSRNSLRTVFCTPRSCKMIAHSVSLTFSINDYSIYNLPLFLLNVNV